MLQNLLSPITLLHSAALIGPPRTHVRSCCASDLATSKAEAELISLLEAAPLSRSARVELLISQLVDSKEQVDWAQLPGEWQLVYTSASTFDARNPLGRRVDGSAPGLEGAFGALTGGASVSAPSSSPIQRAITNAFRVSQSICLEGDDPRVSQRVELPFGELELSAAALLQDAEPKRLSFRFDRGTIRTGGLELPYPVPFKLIGDEAIGWIDTLHLSSTCRVSVGNKGTTFVFLKKEESAS